MMIALYGLSTTDQLKVNRYLRKDDERKTAVHLRIMTLMSIPNQTEQNTTNIIKKLLSMQCNHSLA